MKFKALFRIILINILVSEEQERIVYNYLLFKIL